MENHRRREAMRRLRCLLALAGDYLKYLFMRRRRLMHKVARKALALVHHGDRKNRPWPRRAIMEYEFSCADSPSPAFLAAKRLLRSRLIRSGGAAAAGAVFSCFGSFRADSSTRGTMAAEADSSSAEEEDDEETVETTDDDEGEEEEDQVLVADQGGSWLQCRELPDVDDRAEEFINRFYQQLRAQSFAAVFLQGSP